MKNSYLDHNSKIDKKRSDAYSKMNVYCKKCGHTMFIANEDRRICTHCGYWVYKDNKTEFLYKMKEIRGRK